MDEHRPARHERIPESGGVRYLFFCELSGALVCATDLRKKDNLLHAWAHEGKPMFNLCRRCGRWVSDPMYNAETLECVQCSPWEEQPFFCPQCGEQVVDDDIFCHRCHIRLKYCETEECG